MKRRTVLKALPTLTLLPAALKVNIGDGTVEVGRTEDTNDLNRGFQQ